MAAYSFLPDPFQRPETSSPDRTPAKAKSSLQETRQLHDRYYGCPSRSSDGNRTPCTSMHSPYANLPAASCHIDSLNLLTHLAATHEYSASIHAKLSRDNPVHHRQPPGLLSIGSKHSCRSTKSPA